jgi:GNAT superfamily N-acetyltransferase
VGDALALEQLQEIVFPSLAPQERLNAENFRFHVQLFPEGQFVALLNNQIVGSTTAIRYNFDPHHPHQHQFNDIFDEGFLRTHQPLGNWLYGIDVGVHPQHRGKGIARALYRARQNTVYALTLDGQVTVGMLNGYHLLAGSISVETYYQQLVLKKITDPTVSAQQKIGFEIKGLMSNYLTDPTCGNAGVLLVLDASKKI